ncbi:MAG: DUF488 family protein [Pseudomonadota bacterium]|nr:DUF488 family protein [Pseudomonadota bacterium]
MSRPVRRRKWFNHDRARWEEFKSRYFSELEEKPEREYLLNRRE